MVIPKTATKTKTNSTIVAPSAVLIQKRLLPFSALDVIRMLIGPAIGIEKIKPATKPMSKTVTMLSTIY